MIMSSIFIILLLAIIFAGRGNRLWAYFFFGLSLLLAIVIFIHHLTNQLNLNL